jgi:predicted tellurium resistance membrane protein TerC
VSDIGGLAGLFLGFSLLSLFELILKAFTVIRSYLGKSSCMKNNRQVIKKHSKTRKYTKSQKPHKTRRKVTQNTAVPDIVVIDLLFGEQVEAASVSELNENHV